MTNQALTTIETLTNKQIKALRKEARTAGDEVMVDLCNVALAGADVKARRLIVKAINHTEAQEPKSGRQLQREIDEALSK